MAYQTLKERILQTLSGTKGLTSDDLEAHLGTAHQAISPRLNELARDGLVSDSGRRRQTRSGKPATVWVLATEGATIKSKKLSWKKAFEALLGVTLELVKDHAPPRKRKAYAASIRTIIHRAEGKL